MGEKPWISEDAEFRSALVASDDAVLRCKGFAPGKPPPKPSATEGIASEGIVTEGIEPSTTKDIVTEDIVAEVIVSDACVGESVSPTHSNGSSPDLAVPPSFTPCSYSRSIPKARVP